MLKQIALLVSLALPSAAITAPYLLMAEEDGCFWCAKWNEEIGPIYPKTAEGRLVPLVRYDLNDTTPDVTFDRTVHYTPTFILVDDGKELGRIEGYPGEDFFWGLLGMMLERANIPLDPEG